MKVKEETAGEKRGESGGVGARFANWVRRGGGVNVGRCYRWGRRSVSGRSAGLAL